MDIKSNQPSILVGYGWDIHRLKSSKKGYLIIGGVKILHHQDFEAHSDGDLVFHALVDALLGAMGLGDIGEYFPPSDSQWKNKDSRYFVEETFKLLQNTKYKVSNVDVVIVAESLYMKPYKPLIKSNIAEVLSMDIARVNIKAKTNENLGFLGRSEAIESHVILALSSYS